MKRTFADWFVTALVWLSAVAYCLVVWRGVWCLVTHWGKP